MASVRCIVLHSRRGYLYAAVFGGGRAKGTLKILQELLNHGGLVAVVRAGITYLTSKCPAGAGSPFRILFHDRTLNDASVALNDTVRACLLSAPFPKRRVLLAPRTFAVPVSSTSHYLAVGARWRGSPICICL